MTSPLHVSIAFRPYPEQKPGILAHNLLVHVRTIADPKRPWVGLCAWHEEHGFVDKGIPIHDSVITHFALPEDITESPAVPVAPAVPTNHNAAVEAQRIALDRAKNHEHPLFSVRYVRDHLITPERLHSLLELEAALALRGTAGINDNEIAVLQEVLKYQSEMRGSKHNTVLKFEAIVRRLTAPQPTMNKGGAT